MSLTVNRPGILTTLQDLGRVGYRSLGINPGGAMDRAAVQLLNIMLSNTENDAVLEMHFPAPELTFNEQCIIALGGGNFDSRLDGESIENWRPLVAGAGSKLRFAARQWGNRCYIAVRGGFDIPQWLGSSSTNLAAGIGGLNGTRLAAGDRLPFKSGAFNLPLGKNAAVSRSLLPRYSRFPTVRILAGAEHRELDEASQLAFGKNGYSISTQSDRMGFRLEGPALRLSRPMELVSSAVDFGTIQLLPDGQLIVLMAEAQTAGGYPRLGHVISVDLPLLAQLGANDSVRFHLIEQRHAEDLITAFETELSFFRVGCRFQAQSWTT